MIFKKKELKILYFKIKKIFYHIIRKSIYEIFDENKIIYIDIYLCIEKSNRHFKNYKLI